MVNTSALNIRVKKYISDKVIIKLPRANLASSKANMASWQVNSIGDTIRCLPILNITWKDSKKQ